MIRLPATPTKVLVTIFSQKLFGESLEIANRLRAANIPTMLYSDPGASINKQLKYADKKGIPYTIIIGPDEIEQNKVVLKDLRTRRQKSVPLEKAIETIK